MYGNLLVAGIFAAVPFLAITLTSTPAYKT